MSEPTHEILHHHIDYFPLKIRVFKNGDMFDSGHILAVTRKQFKHWIVFLDALTVLLQTATAIRKLFTIQGIQVQHFDELEPNGEYVAVEGGPFVSVPYGQTRFTMRGKRYNPIIRVPEMIPTFLNSAESMDIYLKKEGYGTITGLPYPFDGILTRSPSASQLQIKHLQSHIPPLKIGGSMEHLNELGGAASWLGKNEKWMMGERVNMGTREELNGMKEAESLSDGQGQKTEMNTNTGSQIQIHVQNMNDNQSINSTGKAKNVTRLPRLANSTSSSRRDTTRPSQKVTSSAMDLMLQNLPPIDPQQQQQRSQIKTKTTDSDSNSISIKTEEQSISIGSQKQEQKESKTRSRVSRRDDIPEVRYHRSYQVTETTYVKNESRNHNEEEEEAEEGEVEEVEDNEEVDIGKGSDEHQHQQQQQYQIEEQEEQAEEEVRAPRAARIQNEKSSRSNKNTTQTQTQTQTNNKNVREYEIKRDEGKREEAIEDEEIPPDTNKTVVRKERAKWNSMNSRKDGTSVERNQNQNQKTNTTNNRTAMTTTTLRKQDAQSNKNIGTKTTTRTNQNQNMNLNLKELKDSSSNEKYAKKQNNKSKENGELVEKKTEVVTKWDADTSEIPKRYDIDFDEGNIHLGVTRMASKIVTSRSSVHLFVDEIVGDEIDDVIARAQLWENNKRKQKMRQQCTQTTSTLRSISVPRHAVQLFDPDFD